MLAIHATATCLDGTRAGHGIWQRPQQSPAISFGGRSARRGWLGHLKRAKSSSAHTAFIAPALATCRLLARKQIVTLTSIVDYLPGCFPSLSGPASKELLGCSRAAGLNRFVTIVVTSAFLRRHKMQESRQIPSFAYDQTVQ